MSDNNPSTIKVGDCVYKFPDHYLAASQLETKLEELKRPFEESDMQQGDKSKTKKGYDTRGIIPQKIIDRVNEVVGITHYRELHEKVWAREKSTSSGLMFEVTYKVTVQIGNYFTILCPNGEIKTGFEVLAERSSYGTHAHYMLADAIKSAITSARKKAWAGFSVGNEAYQPEQPEQLPDNTPRNYGGGAQYRSQYKNQRPTNNTHPQQLANQSNQNPPHPSQNPPTEMVNSVIQVLDQPTHRNIQGKITVQFKAAFKQFSGEVFTVNTVPLTQDQFKYLMNLIITSNELLLKGKRTIPGNIVVANDIAPLQNRATG